MSDKSTVEGCIRWVVLACLLIGTYFVVSAALRAQEPVGEPEVEVTCTIDTSDGRAEVTCTSVSTTHRCQVREVTTTTGPSIPGNGVRHRVLLFCPNRNASTAFLETAPLVRQAESCRWSVPVSGVNYLAFACIGAPGSRQRKLERITIPWLEERV